MSISESDSRSTEESSTPEIGSQSTVKNAAWSPTAIAWICLLFTMLPAGIMYALNFERLGQPERKKRALFFVLISSALYYLFAIRFLVLAHFDSKGTELSVRTWFHIITMAIAWRFYLGQQSLFVGHMKQGGRKASIVVPTLLSLLWMAIFVAGSTGWTYVEESGDLKEFERAVVLMDKGNSQESEAIFKRYKAKYPEDVNAYWNLALIYAQTGRTELAKQELQDLLQVDPDYKDAKDYLRELQELRE